MNIKLEVIFVPVSDPERSKQFYQGLGWHVDAEGGSGDFRLMQITPPGSPCSIILGKGITHARPGSIDRMILAVHDIEAARAELRTHGADVSEVFHDAGGGVIGGFHPGPEGRAPGLDPQRRSYASYATFSDPDGNVWMLQEVKERAPGRGLSLDVETLTELLRETEERHGQYQATAPKHHWSDWYAAYMSARKDGKTADEAFEAGARHMERLAPA